MNKQASFLLLALSLSAACRGEAARTSAPKTAVPVRTAEVERRSWPATFEAGGIVTARTTASVATRVTGTVVAVHVRAGDRVKRGAPLVTLDARELAAGAARAEAGLRGSEQGVRAAEGALRAAEASMTLARATYSRIRALHEKKSATPQELDQAVAAFEGAEAQVRAAEAGLAAATEASAGAIAAAAAAQTALSYATLTAPFDGVIARRSVDPGDMAVPGVPLILIEDPSRLRLEVTIDESRLSAVSASRKARVRFDDDTEDAWTEAPVREIARIEAGSHAFVVKLDLPGDARAATGSSGRARFDGRPQDALVFPAAAAVRRGQLSFVYVVGADRLARLQPVSTGRRQGDFIEILAGLTEKTRVVIAPPPSLIDGVLMEEARR